MLDKAGRGGFSVIHTMSPGLKGLILNLNYGDGIASMMMGLAKDKVEGNKDDHEIIMLPK